MKYLISLFFVFPVMLIFCGLFSFENIRRPLGRRWDKSKHNCLVSYLLCWRHVSATVGHLQVTKIYREENYTEYDHSIGAYCKLSTRSRCRLDYTYWAKSTSGDSGSTVVKVLCYKSEGCWFDPSWCQWIFHWHKILPIALWPWVDSASNRNEYKEYFLGVKVAGV